MVLADARHGWLECNTPDPKRGAMIGSADARSAGGKTGRYVSGQAQEEIASVELRLADGTTRQVRMVRPFFFRALQHGEQPVVLLGRNWAGDVVERCLRDWDSTRICSSRRPTRSGQATSSTRSKRRSGRSR
jgi:hypothetical protein